MAKKCRILITGANGFVGSKIVEYLIKTKKFQVSGLIRKTSDQTFLKPFKKQIKLFYGDIRNKLDIAPAFKNQDIVLHIAAFPSDWGKYQYFYDVNVKGVKNVAELCLQNNVKHMVHFSSISIYGFDKRVNATEQTPVKLNNFHYCRTKLDGEKTIKHFMDVFNLPATIIQPGQVYGPNDRTMTYKIIDALNKKQFALSDNGKYLLSPLYIDNLIQAVILIVQKPKKSIGKTYIITDDVKITWYEFTKYLCEFLEKPMPWINAPGFVGMVGAFFSETIYNLLQIKSAPLMTRYRLSLVGNDFHFISKKLRNELGYRPDQNIKKNLKKTIDSYYDFLNRQN